VPPAFWPRRSRGKIEEVTDAVTVEGDELVPVEDRGEGLVEACAVEPVAEVLLLGSRRSVSSRRASSRKSSGGSDAFLA
jgi:hypothetical protein